MAKAEWSPRGFRQTFGALRPVGAADLGARLFPAEGPGVYIVGGADAWLRQRALRQISNHHLGKEPDPFRRRRLNGASLNRDRLESAARTVAFGGGPVVIVENGRRLAEPLKGRRGEELAAAFVGLVENPPGRAVVAVEWERNPDRRKGAWSRLGKALAAAVGAGRAVVVDADPPPERAMARWIAREASKRRLRLPPGGAELLEDRFGNDLRRQVNEIEKIRIHAGGESDAEVSLEAMEKVLGGGSLRDRFRFTNALQRDDARAALEALDRLLAQGEEPVVLFSMLYRLLVQIQLARTWEPGGKSLASTLGVPAGVAREIARTASRFSDEHLRGLLREAAAMDLRLKSSNLDARAALTALALGVSGSGGQSSRPDAASAARAG